MAVVLHDSETFVPSSVTFASRALCPRVSSSPLAQHSSSIAPHHFVENSPLLLFEMWQKNRVPCLQLFPPCFFVTFIFLGGGTAVCVCAYFIYYHSRKWHIGATFPCLLFRHISHTQTHTHTWPVIAQSFTLYESTVNKSSCLNIISVYSVKISFELVCTRPGI